MVDVFSGRLLVSKDGHSVDPEEALKNKVVGLYFSAGWCSPCRDFTPVLCDFYTELVEESQSPAPFEVVFISSDHSAEEMVGYMHSMHGDWLALPFHDPYKHFYCRLCHVVCEIPLISWDSLSQLCTLSDSFPPSGSSLTRQNDRHRLDC
ncbi:nucleoredoxin-like protein 2 isoform X3 [Coturnix japonica]|uniref:Nucleoredoxin like 2 n=2 Tax=Coturnix japonica TaxID=93934 RepID=A0A8C2TER6_COTJA|nr:nucleoredoxin-like protein 2 isoform X3 [Coturnix japonica]